MTRAVEEASTPAVPVSETSAAPSGNDVGGKRRVAIVTGATSGLGLEIAHVLGRAGHRVVINSRSQRAVDEAVAALTAENVEACGFAADLGRHTECAALIDYAVAQFGRVDVLVNNAARPCIVDALDLEPAEWDNVLALNLSAPLWTAQAAARHMIEQGSGVIVNLSSVMGMTANAHRAAYIASKHGVIGLTRALAVEWGPLGIRTCTVSPSFIETRMVLEAIDDGRLDTDGIRRRTPLRRLGEPGEVARTVRFLVSDDASYLNGCNIPVDGGWLVNADV